MTRPDTRELIQAINELASGTLQPDEFFSPLFMTGGKGSMCPGSVASTVLAGPPSTGLLAPLAPGRKSHRPAGADPRRFVLSLNLNRRHLTVTQKVAAVVACNAWAPTGRPKGEVTAPFATAKEMAKEAGASERTVQQVQKGAL